MPAVTVGWVRRLAKHLLLFVAYSTAGGLVMLVTVYISILAGRPDLQRWQTIQLPGEFTSRKAAQIHTLDGYLQLEDALFTSVDHQIYTQIDAQRTPRYFRFAPGSLADPRRFHPNWNRTQWRQNPNARGAVLLLHGLSDSPYSMRTLARICYQQGFSVLALRLPGHGTAPSALLTADMADWIAAVRLGMQHLQRTHPGQPLYLVGYSMGGALAVDYAASAVLDPELPPVEGIVLISPAIGVSPLAALAPVQASMALLPGLAKLAWTDIQPEYDPYKYNSFTVNAGEQIYRLTGRVSSDLEAASSMPGGRRMPRILAFQSLADATVSAPAVLNTLFMQLPPEGHELVVFDINRNANATALLGKPIAEIRQRLLNDPSVPVNITLVTNANPDTDDVVAVRRAANSRVARTQPLPLRWPPRVYSLSHVALPFPPDDPIYGTSVPPGSQAIFLGRLDLQGERGLLAVPADNLLRLRHNPFFPYLEQRVTEFLQPPPGQ